MNIRKLEDLSKDELIDLIKQERDACDQLVPISVDERLPSTNGVTTPWSDYVIVYTVCNESFIAYYDFEYSEWYARFDLVTDVTHWLPIPEIEE